jgi:DNA replication and repair protein RecF
MRVLSVQMRDFRTYARAEAQLGSSLTVVYGPNGAGKSNLLEAIYFGCTSRSPRTRNDRELVRFGASATRVVVTVEDEHERHELSVGLQIHGEGRAEKLIARDGARLERPLESEQRPLLSVFAPDRLDLVKGPPALRRAHLDQFVSGLWPVRAATRREYARVLAQRNALLGRIRTGSASRATISTWDRELARSALELSADRAAAVGLLEQHLAPQARQLGCQGELAVTYRPRSRARGEEGFVAELQSRLTTDLERGYTGHGPHRDELAIVRDGRELRVFGSQGEQRLALLALLLAERAALEGQRRRMPLMLLDDVMSELDRDRREALVEVLRAGGQAVITTTDLEHVPGVADLDVTSLVVADGSVQEGAAV